MKLKTRPEDFQVEEISDFTPDPAGRFFVYELEKRSLATMEALRILAKKNGMRAKDLSASGLKDKHALTRQLFSSLKPLNPVTGDERLLIKLVGKAKEKLTAGFIAGNRFRITLRSLTDADIAALPGNLDEIARVGIPNYYDNQRFGGIAHGQGFIAKALIRGDFEEAVRLHLAVPHRKQNLTDKKNRRLARDLWGDWERLHKKMRKSSERALVEFLRDGGNYAECFDRITPTLRNLFVAAYQSYLFNETLRRWMLASAKSWVVTRNRAGEIVFPRELKGQWRGLELPLAGANTKLEEFQETRDHMEAVLTAEEITLEGLKLSGLRRTRFKSNSRRALMFPEELEISAPAPDELNDGTHKIHASFTLPRGSFATIVTRRLVLGAHPREETVRRDM